MSTVEIFEDIAKSFNDTRSYRLVTLANKLQALCISGFIIRLLFIEYIVILYLIDIPYIFMSSCSYAPLSLH